MNAPIITDKTQQEQPLTSQQLKQLKQLKKYAAAGRAAEAFLQSCLERQSSPLDSKGQSHKQALTKFIAQTITALDLNILEED